MSLSVEGLAFSYNGRRILDDISFTLSRGELLAVVGVNGAGKTTLLKCLGGILRPERGKVFIEGRETSGMDRTERARRIAYVPQRYTDSDITVFDAVLLGRRPHMGWSLAEEDLRITEDVLQALGLDSMALRPLSTLSGGEIQKVVIGRSLAQEPDLLLLDEPTSNLDLKAQMEIMSILTRVAQQSGLSTIAVMHDINTALRFADRFLMVKEGRIHSLTPRASISEDVLCQVFGVDVLMGIVEGYHVVVPASSA